MMKTYKTARKKTVDEELECFVGTVDLVPNAVIIFSIYSIRLLKFILGTVLPHAQQKTEIIQEKAEDTSMISSCLPGAVHRRQRSMRRVNHKNLTAAPNDVNLQHATEEFPGHNIMEHHTSQPHSVVRRRARRKRKRKSRREAEQSSDTEVVPSSSFGSFRCRERSKRINSVGGITQQQGKMDTDTFECYLGKLWRSLSEEKSNSFTYLDCLWFILYMKGDAKERVLNWIKRKNIFSTKYVFVPIVQWCHWSLLIFCHFGESTQSKTRTPCMLLLDSLQMSNPKRLEPGIRKFVFDIYESEDRPENKKLIKKIPLLIPKVPQQRNGEECGNYVLYYIKLFIESAPENFSIAEGYPYFMKKDWFTTEGLECFCKELDSFCH
ncbi:uncharacterized protein LOC132303935 isoform X2 [Cornus florida]|uniref:uncharacterized protein LOC132303935 isoform X2 n=1 Tax=Cornus florida TaxID=4283 RepID=UPI0028A1D80A|nr:uncharacterized protein LOC132303935 isoform X2 [Cornus florida]